MTATSTKLLRALFQLLAEEENPTARLREIIDMVDEWDASPRQYAGRLEPFNSIIAAGLEDRLNLQVVDWLLNLTRPQQPIKAPEPKPRVRRSKAEAPRPEEPVVPVPDTLVPLTEDERLNLALEKIGSKLSRPLVGQERQAKARRLRQKWARELRVHPDPSTFWFELDAQLRSGA